MFKSVLCGFVFILAVNNVAYSAEHVADKVLVLKSKRQLHLIYQDKIYKTYNINLGRSPIGHKKKQGDKRTPEGLYTIDFRNPDSKFTLSLHINYPSRQDRAAAKARGESPGGDIFIHGLPNGNEEYAHLYRKNDWTDGCIALTSDDIRQLWQEVKNGTRIEIRP